MDAASVTAAPKPPFTIRQRKALKSRPRPVNVRAARETFDRDGWACQWCRRPGGALVPHHRLRRSAGGRDEARVMVSVHSACHDEIHRRVAEAKARGFLVSSVDDLDRGWT